MTEQDKITSSVPVRTVAESSPPLSVWEPLGRVRSEVERLLEDFWNRPLGFDLNRRIQALAGPALELTDKDGEYELVAEVPGMKPEEIEIKVTDGILRLSGEKKVEHKETREGCVFSERRFGRFERALELPRGVDVSKITANAKDGVLAIHLPKTDEARQRERKIEISA